MKNYSQIIFKYSNFKRITIVTFYLLNIIFLMMLKIIGHKEYLYAYDIFEILFIKK